MPAGRHLRRAPGIMIQDLKGFERRHGAGLPKLVRGQMKSFRRAFLEELIAAEQNGAE